jgi:thymidylate kinase
MFIVLEGTDGSGKSTLCEYLSNKYSLSKQKSIGGVFNKVKNHFDIDKVSINERFSFLCGEAINNSLKVSEFRKNKKSLIFDRYYFSTLVYCESMLPGVTRGFKFLFSKLEQPEIVIFVNVDYENMIRRLESRGNLTLIENKFTNKNDYNKLVKNYLKFLPTNTIILDNNSSLEDLIYNASKVIDNYIERQDDLG